MEAKVDMVGVGIMCSLKHINYLFFINNIFEIFFQIS